VRIYTRTHFDIISKKTEKMTGSTSNVTKTRHVVSGTMITMAKVNMDIIEYMHFLNCTAAPIRLLLIPIG
jgi:hypothetical protein